MLTSLPPETLIKVILLLPAQDISNLAKCCKILAQIAKLNIVWEQKSKQDYNVKLDSSNSRICEFKDFILKKSDRGSP